MATKPEYNGKYADANQPTTNKWIQVFVSDWNKDCFAFYAYIDKNTYKEDIKNIWELVNSFGYGGDIYVELIDYRGLKKFYDYLYKKGHYTHSAALDPNEWRKWFK